jgi:hypothetical protein
MSPIPVQLPTSVSLPLPKLPDDNTMMLSSSASTMPATPVATSEAPLYVKLLTAGTAACVADIVTFPLDTAKVRLQVSGNLNLDLYICLQQKYKLLAYLYNVESLITYILYFMTFCLLIKSRNYKHIKTE